jgi:cytochrome P450
MVSLDPPEHGRLRKPAARAFTPRRVDEMAPHIRAGRRSFPMPSTRGAVRSHRRP